MKISAVFPVHYGKEYFRQAVEAVAPLVDRLIVVYTPAPSFGHWTDLPNPDGEGELRACCDGIGGKLEWQVGRFGSEGEHRNRTYELAAGSDLIVQCDADEVWETADLARCIRQAHDAPFRTTKVHGFVHFWRSFDWCCRDVWGPERFIKPAGEGSADLRGTVYHFGYAQSERIMRYKWSIHGHHNELRPDWFTERWSRFPEVLSDLHPCVYNWWNAERFDKTTLPAALKAHPYYDLPVIA